MNKTIHIMYVENHSQVCVDFLQNKFKIVSKKGCIKTQPFLELDIQINLIHLVDY